MLGQLAYSRTNVGPHFFYSLNTDGNMGLGYSQCLPLTSTPAPTTQTGPSSTATSTTSAPGSTTCSGTRTKFKYFGVNQSGGEFGSSKWPVNLSLYFYSCCVDLNEPLVSISPGCPWNGLHLAQSQLHRLLRRPRIQHFPYSLPTRTSEPSC